MPEKRSFTQILREIPKNLLHFFTAQPGNFVSSAKEMKKLSSITGVAMLLALSIILDQFSIYILPELKLGVGYLITALLGMLYGPVTGGLAAGAGDIIKYIIKPTGPYFFGFTLNAILGGVLYGIFLYKGRTKLPRCIAAKTCINLLVNSLLGTLWSSMLYGKGFLILLPARLLKNFTMLPVEIIVLFLLTTADAKLLQRYRIGGFRIV